MDVGFLAKAGALLEKIRTPLALGGLTVLVLFFLYDKILDLKIFPKLEGIYAYGLIKTLLNNVFWLALLAVLLGGVSYLLQFLSRGRPAEEKPPAKTRKKG
jgi:hypothetical protein